MEGWSPRYGTFVERSLFARSRRQTSHRRSWVSGSRHAGMTIRAAISISRTGWSEGEPGRAYGKCARTSRLRSGCALALASSHPYPTGVRRALGRFLQQAGVGLPWLQRLFGGDCKAARRSGIIEATWYSIRTCAPAKVTGVFHAVSALVLIRSWIEAKTTSRRLPTMMDLSLFSPINS